MLGATDLKVEDKKLDLTCSNESVTCTAVIDAVRFHPQRSQRAKYLGGQ
jgi:hypothetical protein